MSVFDAVGFDFHDLSGDLEPLILDVMTTPAADERAAAFADVRDRIIDHFEAVEPTLYLALRRFPHLSMNLMEAERARDEIRRCLTSLSLVPADSDAWMGLFVALSEGVRRYFADTEARLVQVATQALGKGELRRLGVEANRIRGLYAAEYNGRETVGD